MSRVATYTMLFLGMAFFGSATPISKLVVEHFPVFIGGALRVLAAFLILLPFVDMKRFREYRGRDGLLLIGIGVLGVVGFTALLLYGMRMVSGVAGSIVMSTAPAITAGLSWLFFRDHFGWKKGAALALAVAGVLVLHLGGGADGGETSIIGILLVLGAIVCDAGYTLMGKGLTDDYPPIEIAAFSALIGFLAFIPAAIWQVDSSVFAEVPTEGWLALAWYGVGTMGIGSVLWYKGVQQVEGSTAAGFMGVMPVSALILSYVLLGEAFDPMHLIGFGLVAGGVALIIRAHMEMER